MQLHLQISHIINIINDSEFMSGIELYSIVEARSTPNVASKISLIIIEASNIMN